MDKTQTAVAMGMPDDAMDRWVFRGLLLVLFWAPLPLASNRVFLMGILVALVQGLLLVTLFAWRHHADAAFARIALFRWPLLCLAAFTALPWLQLLPLPEAVLAVLSPEAAAVRAGFPPQTISLDPYQTRVSAALAFSLFCVFGITLLTIRSRARLEALAMAFVLLGVFQAVVGVALFALGMKYRIFYFDIAHSRIFGTFSYHNFTAGYLEICLSMGIGLMLARLAKERQVAANWRERFVGIVNFMLGPKMRLRLMLVIMVIALVLTRSRMGNGGFFVAMLLVGVLTIAVSRKLAPATIGLIASLVIIDVVIVGTWVGLEKVVNRVQETTVTEVQRIGSNKREESFELRMEGARHGLDLVADFPLLGTGGGTFHSSYLRYRTLREGGFDHAHNDYVEIAADYGLLGLGVLGSFVALSLWRGVQILRQRRSSLPRGIAFGGLMAAVALLFHSVVDFNLQNPTNAMMILVALAMIWVADGVPSGRRRGTRQTVVA